ncbi:MAG: hypothetical protein GTO02_03885 [Candidatus Dadabacteria bacterium]|nr:hypothetical protein [Candidatus Dadabacteria bacterium]NIQ13566.1 hypothetical protein [Candidatus Dadabacteria bacterium]
MEDKKVSMNTGRKCIVFFLLVFVVLSYSGCISVLDRAAAKVDNMQQRFFKTTRKPGERQVNSAEETYATYYCRTSRIYFESIEVLPKKVLRGEEINQRMRFAYCLAPKDQHNVIEGNIIRKIFKNKQEQFADVTRYTFKPGTWIIDAFLEIPPDADGGIYSINVSLDYGDKLHTRLEEFEVGF